MHLSRVLPPLLLALACADERAPAADVERAAVASDSTPVPPVIQLAAPLDSARAHQLEDAAESIVRFLYGDRDFEELPLADSVTLHVSAEGGGGMIRKSAAELQSPDAWVVPSAGSVYSFVPAGSFDRITTRAGSHFNCFAYPLSLRAPALAAEPHVGVRLEREGGNCLQTWNATFVFDTLSTPPRLIAALYDQWEW